MTRRGIFVTVAASALVVTVGMFASPSFTQQKSHQVQKAGALTFAGHVLETLRPYDPNRPELNPTVTLKNPLAAVSDEPAEERAHHRAVMDEQQIEQAKTFYAGLLAGAIEWHDSFEVRFAALKQ